MPFPYAGSVASTRSRRVREKEKDGRQSSTTGRRSKEHSRTVKDRRSPPRIQSSELFLYAQHNVTLDQLPPLPSSGATSPSSSTSPVLRVNQLHLKQPEVPRLSHHFHTPASLQPYLQDEDEVDDKAERPLSESLDNDKSSVVTQESPQRPLQPLPKIQKNTPQQSFEEAVCDLASSCPTIPLRTQQESPIVPSPRLFNSGQHRPSFGYSPIAHPSPPSVPAGTIYHNQQYFVPRYPIPHHFAMVQPSNRGGGVQQMHVQPMSYLGGYGYAGRPPMPFNPMNNMNHQPQGQSNFEHDVPTSPRGGVAGGDPGTGMNGGFSNTHDVHDDTAELLHRIQDAIPDIHLLLQRYRETSGRLGVQESMIRQAELQTTEALRQKEIYIEQLAKEMDSKSQKHAAETSKLRLEIGNLEEKHKELLESVVSSRESRAELEASHDTWKEQFEKDYEVRERSLKAEAQGKMEAEAAVESTITEMGSMRLTELRGLEAKWGQERKELQDSYTRNIKDLEAALEDCRADLENALQREQEGHESWNKERESLHRSRDEQRAALCREWEEERRSLLTHHERSLEELQQELRSRTPHHGSNSRMEDENERLRQQIDGLKLGWDADKAKLKSENARLRRMIEAFGEATDLKSRGDTFFIDAFSELHNGIKKFGKEYCKGPLTESLPSYASSKIPADVPDFTSDSVASIGIRAAYVQHVISSTLAIRVFQPFLFTLSHRHEPANRLFEDMSRQLRRKSTRRESSWRQHTLHAAYTASSAKQAVNKVAAEIVKEICSDIKYLISYDDEEQVQAAVRRIVKIAAETWRYARLEKDVIRASMSPEQHPATFDAELTPSDQKHIPHRHVRHILPLLPLIEREPRHEEIPAQNSNSARGCVYIRGLALYPNSSIVMARRAELQRAVGQKTDVDNPDRGDHPSQTMPALNPGDAGDRGSGQSIPFLNVGSSVRQHSPEAGPSGFSRNQSHINLGDDIAAAREEETSRLQRRTSRATRSRSSASSVNNEQSQSPATPPTEVVPDWSGSSGTIPPILDTW